MEVTRRDHFLMKYGMEPFKVLVDDTGVASVFLMFKGLVAKKQLFEEAVLVEEVAMEIFQGIVQDNFVFCPGLREEAILCLNNITFTPQKVKVFTHPVEHYAANDCLVWYKPPSNTPLAEFTSGKYSCVNCNYVSRYCKKLSVKKLKKLSNSPNSSFKNQRSPRSTHKLKYLSPKSLQVRSRKARSRRFRLFKTNEKLLKKCDKFELFFDEKKSNQMVKITEIINRDFKEQLDNVISELPSQTGNDEEIKNTLKEVWVSDSREQHEKDKLDFKKDQDRNCKGKRLFQKVQN